MAKKIITILIIFICMLTTFAIPAFADASVGSLDSKKYDLMGTVDQEKQQEGMFFQIITLGATGAAVAGGPFATLVVGGTGTALVDIYKKYANWENWPVDRWVFGNYNIEANMNVAQLGDNILYSTQETIANLIFDATKFITKLSISFCILAFHTDVVTSMLGWLSQGLKGIFDVNAPLVQLIMKWGLVFLLAYTVFWFVKRELSSIISSILVAALAVGSVFFFVGNAQQLIGGFSSSTDQITGIFLDAIGKYLNNDSSISAPTLDKGLISMGQAVWETIVADPWAAGMFGTVDPNNLKITDDERNLLLQYKGDFTDPSKLEQELQDPQMTIDNLYLATVGQPNDDVMNVLSQATAAKNVLQSVKKEVYNIFGIKDNSGYPVDHGGHQGTIIDLGCNELAPLYHIIVAVFSLIPAIAFAFLAGSVALSIIVCQIMLAAMLLVLPIFLFALMVPHHGWSTTEKYFRHLLGFFLVKISYGLYLSLVLTIGTMFVKVLLK